MKPEEFYVRLADLGFPLTDRQKSNTNGILSSSWNGMKRLISPPSPKRRSLSQAFYDSIAPILQGLIENQPIRLLDIGAGAGFPSLPMKILFPELDVTIIDSL